MLLGDVIGRLDVLGVTGDLRREVRTVTRDSRRAGPGALFVAVRGGRVDGHDLVPALGPVAGVVVETDVPAPPGVPIVRVRDSRRALALAAAAVHGDPARAVPVVGVTGTNGKTTVVTLIEGALRALGRPAGRIGTTGAIVAGEPVASELTTPEAPELQGLLARMRDAGCEAVAMEVSSHGLELERVAGIPFHLAVFTNLTRDHLDFHGTPEAYARAKARLFTEHLRPPGGPPRALLCADDPSWEAMRPPADRWLYGVAPEADVRLVRVEPGSEGTTSRVRVPGREVTVRSRLFGRHNAANLAAALGACLCLGVSADDAAAALEGVDGVPGRLERVPDGRGRLVLVDYAHTEDALAVALAAAREVSRGRLTVVFGCGGDRDRGKRPAMGRVVAAGADRIVLTSDNPRTEDPRRIVDDVLAGMERPPERVELDRAEAIRWAIATSSPGDTVLVAGKGHETYQDVGGVRHPFDDRAVARAALEEG